MYNNNSTKIFVFAFLLILIWKPSTSKNHIFLEAESFEDRGGWVIDQQSMDQMGSPYLLAHGMGVPVEDAKTQVHISEKGKYRIWVRTRDWTALWRVSEFPGEFQVLIDNKPVKTIFGTKGAEWHWQNGGTIQLKEGKVEIALHDMTGFNGRCDAIILTKDLRFTPPVEYDALAQFRRDNSGFPKETIDAGEFDLVVVGGGMAGICTAVTAARLGCKVALIQNRPVLGGNNSSEVRVGLSGLIFQDPYPKLGKLVDEIGSVGHWTLWEAKRNPESERSKRILEIIKNNPEKKIHNAGPKSNYGDDKKLKIVSGEKNIELFLNTHVFAAQESDNRIISVTAKDIVSGKELLFKGQLFADCTGDGNLGYLAGADYRIGRESSKKTGESSAPNDGDNLIMGTSVQWYAEELDSVSSFPECPWAVQFTEETCQYLTHGDWNWETGFFWDQVEDIEHIRDYGLRAVYGNWSFLKNKSKDKKKYQNYKLKWVAYIGGKRESRRLLGDVILKEQDLIQRTAYPDASFTTTWTIDLHYPLALEGFTEEPFLSEAKHIGIEPYAVPYRCLYSRNIENLFMAGRNISVTHVALGTVRVMRTTGMMGEVVGMAAAICVQEDCSPRDVYQKKLNLLKSHLVNGVPQNN
ncbi:FAD-dependent oxidoreductase [Maribellus comscasis]|uniref:FAD-dependent oxidoreductase n=1 Tax=Maribellus comscasis TaxID=2681766 RepID=A0A6I6K1L5_9BACT|nr:FAD-dependent oxidoreductase [Maribellus comscasis]QGY47509.1 FAD-dependent oxidoreductase [Maribellus comscasis]